MVPQKKRHGKKPEIRAEVIFEFSLFIQTCMGRKSTAMLGKFFAGKVTVLAVSSVRVGERERKRRNSRQKAGGRAACPIQALVLAHVLLVSDGGPLHFTHLKGNGETN